MKSLRNIFIALAFVALSAGAVNAQTSGSCGATLNWELTGTGDNLTLTISGTGAMTNYSGGTAPWYSQRANIKTLVLENGMTTIGSFAFQYCSGLTGALTIPNSVTTIAYYAFASCGSLTSVTIGNSVTTIADWAFRDCTSLNTVTFNATNCSTMGSSSYPVFAGCGNVTTLNIGNNVTTIPDYAFVYCGGTLNFNAANCSTIGDSSFDDYTTLNIGNSVTTIPNYFYYFSLTAINVDDNNQNYSSDNGVLFNKNKTVLIRCPRGKTGALTIPNSVTTIGIGAFSNCWALTGNLTIPNSVTTIGNGAFYYCSGLTGALTIPNSVTTIGVETFFGCYGLTSVTIPNNVTTINNGAFQASGLTSVTIPNSVTTIGSQAFWCENLTSVTVNWATPLSINSNVFGNLTLSNRNLYVPCGSSGLYAVTPVWEDFNINEGFAITATAGSNGTISDEGITNVNCGADKTFTFTPNAGYHVSAVLINGTPEAVTGNTYTFTNVTEDKTIHVTFAIDTFTITATAGSNGIITPSGAVAVTYGEDTTFTFAPNAGYHVSEVLINGTPEAVTGNTYTFTNVTEDKTIHVTFVDIDTFTITATAGSNGTITPSGAVAVTYGEDTTFTFTPNTGYHVATVLINGTPETVTGNSYTFTNVTEDKTIHVTFAIDTFTITATAGNNGIIAPSGTVAVNYGEDKTFTFTPDTDYEIDEVLIDDVPNAVAKENGYHTFENVTANHTISVTFKATVGIADILANSISIYPTPTQNELTIDGGDLQINRVEICDLAGRVVFGQPQGSPLQINVSALPAGVYLIKIHTEKGIVTRKVVKN